MASRVMLMWRSLFVNCKGFCDKKQALISNDNCIQEKGGGQKILKWDVIYKSNHKMSVNLKYAKKSIITLSDGLTASVFF